MNRIWHIGYPSGSSPVDTHLLPDRETTPNAQYLTGGRQDLMSHPLQEHLVSSSFGAWSTLVYDLGYEIINSHFPPRLKLLQTTLLAGGKTKHWVDLFHKDVTDGCSKHSTGASKSYLISPRLWHTVAWQSTVWDSLDSV